MFGREREAREPQRLSSSIRLYSRFLPATSFIRAPSRHLTERAYIHKRVRRHILGPGGRACSE